MPKPGRSENPVSPEQENQRASLEKIKNLMVDPQFLLEVAMACDQAYRDHFAYRASVSGHQVEEWMERPLVNKDELALLAQENTLNFDELELDLLDYRTIYKTLREWVIKLRTHRRREEIITRINSNVLGWFALQTGLSKLINESNDLHELLKRIIADRLTDEEKNMFCRLANLSWLSGAQFRGRANPDNVKPFDLLSDEEKYLDLIQIKAAAQVAFEWLYPAETNAVSTYY